MDWQKHVELAEHHKALGQTKVSLGQDEEKPWEFVSKCDAGGTYRNGTNVSVYITAAHASGLTFTWFLDLEKRGSNGSGEFHLDTEGVSFAMHAMPPGAAKQLGHIIREAAAAARERAKEYSEAAGRQMDAASQFERLADRSGAARKV